MNDTNPINFLTKMWFKFYLLHSQCHSLAIGLHYLLHDLTHLHISNHSSSLKSHNGISFFPLNLKSVHFTTLLKLSMAIINVNAKLKELGQ